MGRLPLSFAKRNITFRIPWSMPGEVNVTQNANGVLFPDTLFSAQSDKPLEIHRMVVRLTAFDAQGVMFEPQPASLAKRVRLKVKDLSKNEDMMKAAHLVDTMQKANELTWEWDEPYTIVRSEGFQVQVDTQSFAYTPFSTLIPDPPPTITTVRVEIAFEGFQIVVAPPTEDR